MANECLWALVAVFFLCAALGVALNFDPNTPDVVSISRAATQSAMEANRVYSRTAIGACLACLLIATADPKWFRRALRALKSPLVWASTYQALIALHYLSDGNTWDLARGCGVSMLLMVTLSASRPMELAKYVSKMLLLFRLLLWMSLIVAILLPNHAWQHAYSVGFIPGIKDRFVGIGEHANGMGAIASIAVLLELDRLLAGRAGRWLSILHIGIGSALAILTQSKTSLIACAVCGIYLVLGRETRLISRLARALVLATAVLVVGCVVWSAISDWAASHQSSLVALSGRVPLWSYYWELGLQRPWFGYGRALWVELSNNPALRYQWAAGNAHNQLLQSFLMCGVFGVVCLVSYVTALFRKRRGMDARYRTLFTGCLLFMVIRSFSEAGFEPGSLGVVNCIQTVLVGFCLCRHATRHVVCTGRMRETSRVVTLKPILLLDRH
ncbi:MAG: O-antigen ligase family protein [Acidobacteriia bacterium]|nr:O-antigen ligase family protein [Terriglobia bacterium]